jgi:hypothetical protein
MATDHVCCGCHDKELQDKLDEYEHSFELRWASDKRAIKRWQKATGRHSEWPDHTDLCVWLMNQLEAK